jgi:diadenosine tetraphosphate (Ap4A) HIT family hydrolase
MSNCIFCKIVSGEMDSAKIWEDSEFLAILDINPNTRGVALVLTKKHFDSYAFDMPSQDLCRFVEAAKKVARILEKGLGVKRISMVIEGMGINHAHIKLYPLHGIDQKFQEIWGRERVFFDKYEGYISTQLGPQVDIQELRKLAEEIRKGNSDIY